MKMKAFTIFLIFLVVCSSFLYSLGYKKPIVSNVTKYSYLADMEIDLEKYKLYIANGDTSFLQYQYLSDMLLGTLTLEELNLLRNMFYASKGYKFDDETLTNYFSKFKWYKGNQKKVTLSPQEKKCIEKIETFEKNSNYSYEYLTTDKTWYEFNGGADQKGAVLKLGKNSSFEYIPEETINRVKKITGTWRFSNGNLYLNVNEMLILLGGYISDHPNTPFINDGYLVNQIFSNPVVLRLPVEKMNDLIKNKKNWLKIGNKSFHD